MNKDETNRWLVAFKRECMIRKGVILHGNLKDLFLLQGSRNLLSAVEAIRDILYKQGTERIIVWDSFKGPTELGEKRGYLQELIRESVLTRDELSNEEGTFGPDLDLTSYSNPEQFFPIIHRVMTGDRAQKYAIIIDWTHYVFGESRNLGEQDKKNLLMLSKAIRDGREESDVKKANEPNNIIIFLSDRLGAIPPIFYQNNPMVKEIVVPLPARPERSQFLQQFGARFKVRDKIQEGEGDFEDYVDMLDGLTLREIQHLIRLSHQNKEAMEFSALVSLYKYGDQKSPWETLDATKIRRIQKVLSDRVKGQDQAIQKVASVIKRARTGLSGLQHSKYQKSPKGTLFFVGPTGVGKTELAKALAEFLFGDENRCIRFDMSEFNHEQSDQRLVGAPPGYVGYEEGGQLTNAVRDTPFAVLLFDEIEKAHQRILDKFLQILEDGRLTDGKGDTVFFSETVIIFTSNIGTNIDQISPDDSHKKQISPESKPEEVYEHFTNAVRKHFTGRKVGRPELLNRLGNNIVPFNFISNESFMTEIIKAKLQPLKQILAEKYGVADLRFEDEKAGIEALVSQVNKKNGGRGIVNEIQTRILDPIADFLFEFLDQKEVLRDKKLRLKLMGSGFICDLEEP